MVEGSEGHRFLISYALTDAVFIVCVVLFKTEIENSPQVLQPVQPSRVGSVRPGSAGPDGRRVLLHWAAGQLTHYITSRHFLLHYCKGIVGFVVYVGDCATVQMESTNIDADRTQNRELG